jgi:hypothetical protein
MTPEEHEEANRRRDKWDLNTPEGRAEDKRLLTENVRRLDALLAARGDTLSDSTRELVLNLRRMTREAIDIGDAMPFVPETVPEELPPPLDKDQ